MQLLELILPRGRGSYMMNLLSQTKSLAITCLYGYGSANIPLENALHVDKLKKEIVMAIIEDEDAKQIFDKLDDKLKKGNTGIGFAIPLDSKGAGILDKAYEYVAVNVIVDRHDGHKAIEIAQENGAKGATLVHGRGSAEKVKSIFMNMNIEPEKDIVIMLVKKDLVETITDAIYKEMNLAEENKGIIYTLPVIAVSGLVDQ